MKLLLLICSLAAALIFHGAAQSQEPLQLSVSTLAPSASKAQASPLMTVAKKKQAQTDNWCAGACSWFGSAKSCCLCEGGQ